jgi:hypothetical protein
MVLLFGTSNRKASKHAKKLFRLIFEISGFHIHFPFVILLTDRHGDKSPCPRK